MSIGIYDVVEQINLVLEDSPSGVRITDNEGKFSVEMDNVSGNDWKITDVEEHDLLSFLIGFNAGLFADRRKK
jgi:hypothetical protein